MRVCFANTHSSLGDAAAREKELAFIAAHLSSPFLLTGDFNTQCDEELHRAFPGAQLTNREGARLPSFYSTGVGIDNIVYTPPFRLCEAALDRVAHSDHYMLYAEFEIDMA